MRDEDYMKLAIKLAKKGCGHTAPNPLVGAVIVKNKEIIGQGWHEEYGGPHAERNALNSCSKNPQGATMYVTLEPCCHQGKQPPCVDAIIGADISRVFIGSFDPNPLVSGKGIRILKEHGIEVYENCLKDECDKLNEIFFHFIRTKTPFVTMKYAMTMDGKIATVSGASKWITGEIARQHVHTQRNRHTAIMVGVGTVLADDPLLTCRIDGGKNPVRIICDTKLRTPLTAQIVTTARQFPTILATCCEDRSRYIPYEDLGCRILPVSSKDNHIDLVQLMKQLGQMQIDSILLEGGSTLNWSALESGIVHKLQTYIAPKLFGGSLSTGPVGGLGVNLPSTAFLLRNSNIRQLGEDFLIESEVILDVYRDY